MNLKGISAKVAQFIRDESGFLNVNGSGPSGASETLTLSVSRTSVVEGEGVGFCYDPGSMTGTGAFADIYRDLHFETDLDNPTGTFETLLCPDGNNTAKMIPSMGGNIAWLSPGTKTLTQTAHQTGKVAHAQGTQNVTVTALDDVAWDVVIYHRPSGNFTGIPADGAVVDGYTVRRTQTYDNVRNWDSLWSPGDNVRVVLEDGANMNIDAPNSASLESNGSGLIVIHNESMGAAGTRQTWTATTWPAAAIGLFQTGSTSSTRCGRIVIIGLDFELGGNPQTGENLTWHVMFSPAIFEGGGQPQYVSFTESRARGMNYGMITGGDNTGISTADAHVFFQACDWGDHFDYIHFHGGGRLWAGANGCSFLPHPFTSTGDGKVSADVNNWMPNHALATRWQNCFIGFQINCWLGGAADWFGTNEPDLGCQECTRWIPHVASTGQAPMYGMVLCRGTSGRGLFIHHNANGAAVMEPECFLIDRCLLATGRHNRFFGNAQCGSIYIRNPVVFLSEAYSDALGSWDFSFLRLDTVEHGTTVGQCYLDNPTVLSDRNSTFGGNNNYAHGLFVGGRSSGELTVSNPAIHVPGHANAGAFPSPGGFARGDGPFKPLAGNSVIGAVPANDYRPVVDFEGATSPAIGEVANAGAFQSVAASDPGVAAIANTVAPTLSRLTNPAGSFILINPETWTGITSGPLGPLGAFMWHPRWSQGINSRDGDDGTLFKEDDYPGSGAIGLNLTYFNLDGQSVTVSSSNTL